MSTAQPLCRLAATAFPSSRRALPVIPATRWASFRLKVRPWFRPGEVANTYGSCLGARKYSFTDFSGLFSAQTLAVGSTALTAGKSVRAMVTFRGFGDRFTDRKLDIRPYVPQGGILVLPILKQSKSPVPWATTSGQLLDRQGPARASTGSRPAASRPARCGTRATTPTTSPTSAAKPTARPRSGSRSADCPTSRAPTTVRRASFPRRWL